MASAESLHCALHEASAKVCRASLRRDMRQLSTIDRPGLCKLAG